MQLDDRQKKLLGRTFLDYQSTEAFLQNPIVVSRAEGVYYWDTEGRRYFDGIGGIFVANLGHGHPRVIEAVKRQLDTMSFSPPMHGTSDIALDFVERVGEVTPGTLNFVKPFSGGSESMEAAMKFARQYYKQTDRPHKYKFVSRYLGYHGSTFGAMAASGTGKRKTPFEPQMPGFIKVYPPSYYRDRFASWEECNRFCAQMFEDAIINEDPDTVAGVIVEPIGNTGGIITPTEEYFHLLREICDRHDVLLIFDEIITGWGRTGSMFAAETFGAIPDIICSGKALSNGTIPLGAMIAREDMAEAFKGDPAAGLNFAHGHTYAGSPVGCAAGLAVINEIVEKDLAARAGKMGTYLAEKLEGLKKYGVVREVRGRGLIRGVEFVKDTNGLQPFPELGMALKKTALQNGLIIRVDPTWFAVVPALVISKDEVDEMCELIDRSLQEALAMV
ncbi:MAG: aspartate aminotransferase family protein [Gemmatimonadetes bacterium]|jgi:adenosylmethionine-8-amino-7-oxononanoate aminotransferase|nr:aspartate aminotransferase family protein [Gemmatimonadota bacterium]MBT5449303.1 aspartate aminotransferase family protein [Gemmatimonadota bacterium]MBT5804242.1 aspartate aminotransferase family protein [Gemmatimonadota bacterium]MBT6620370.1 aspartate aminotransferase family protein [Gemmatimonadota bacterium]MBT6904500.1 aspartate aminotransferase family protein [Gemmatimonadota bacterium]|tara:strand:- start:1742 stop:3079 length:1338 start_codon:yes stop_codon:yes gene_type:complete